MGIKSLMKVLNDNVPTAIKEININQLNGKKIAIDTSIILYQYVTAIRSTGEDLKGPDGKSTSHIQGILSKSLNYLRMGIIPIFIFDGKPPELKMKILNDRSKIKKEAINKLIELEEKVTNPEPDIVLDDETLDILEAEKIKLLKQSVSISHSEMLQAYEIVKLLGIPAILAPEEADSQCAYLSINDMVDFVATEDMDLLTFGSNSIIRNFTKKNMLRIDLEDILTEGELTMDQFIDICILLGCDYTETIDGIGPKRAWDLIKKYGSLEELISKEKKIAQAKYKLPDNFRYNEAREYFKNPRHKPVAITDLELKAPQLNELKQLLMSKYGFAEDSVEKSIKFLRKKYNILDKTYEEKKLAELNDDPFIDDVSDTENMTKSKTSKAKTNQAKTTQAKTIPAKPIPAKTVITSMAKPIPAKTVPAKTIPAKTSKAHIATFRDKSNKFDGLDFDNLDDEIVPDIPTTKTKSIVSVLKEYQDSVKAKSKTVTNPATNPAKNSAKNISTNPAKPTAKPLDI